MKKLVSSLVCVVIALTLAVLPCTAAKYGNNYSEKITRVFSFDDMSEGCLEYANGMKIDKNDKKQGSASLSYTTRGEEDVYLFQTRTDVNTFKLSTPDRNKAALRFWVYISDISLLHVDDENDGDTTQGTMYLKIASNRFGGSKSVQWRHTVHKSGWSEIELPLYHGDDWEDDDFDSTSILFLSMHIKAAAGLTFKIDDFRFVEKSADYTPNPAPENSVLVTNCDYNEFNTEITNWQGASYDTADKVEGSSSYRIDGKGTSDEYRFTLAWVKKDYVPIIIDSDTLHLSIKGTGLADISKVYIQMRLGPKTRSSEAGGGKSLVYNIPTSQLKEGEWVNLSIPLANFNLGGRPDKNTEYGVYLFRIVPYGSNKNGSYTVKLDRIYIERDPTSANVSALIASRLASIAASDAAAAASDAALLSSASDPSDSGNDTVVMIVGIAAGAVIIIAVAVIIIVTKKKPAAATASDEEAKPDEPESKE